jgi:hypothetical protein
VGPLTWGSLFAVPAITTVTTASDPLLAETLKIAATQIGVIEQPLGSNRGTQVDQYLQSVGIDIPPQEAFLGALPLFISASDKQPRTWAGRIL